MSEQTNAYFSCLIQSKTALLPLIEALLAECESLPVGNGFIDLITPKERSEQLIAGVTELGVAIRGVTLWCDCTEENKIRYGCPHGYGGPRHGTGFFSEMCETDWFNVEDLGIDVSASDVDPESLVAICNDLARQYARVGMAQRSDYSPCLVPGFWLCVPAGWVRQSYMVNA